MVTGNRTYRVEEHSVVTITYELKNRQGLMLEDRSSQNPCSFICGLNQVLPALEQSLFGQTKGFSKDLVLSPENAYGLHQPHLIIDVPRSNFPTHLKLEKGM